MDRLPDFIIIGAMKCGTSTLHEQLARQPGFHMSRPKEPQFFSDDDQYARGLEWYRSFFEAADPQALCGESSTNYAKLPTHPQTVPRMRQHLGDHVRFIYVVRHPIDRLVSQYIHEWTRRNLSGPIDAAVASFPGLVEYGCYAMQLGPYLEAFGRDRVLLVFFESLVRRPQWELDRITRFLGIERLAWREDLGQQNVSSERMRKSALRDAIVEAPVLSYIRKRFVPQAVRDRIKKLWMMEKRPQLAPEVETRLVALYDADLARLSAMTGIPLSCASFSEQALAAAPEWK